MESMESIDAENSPSASPDVSGSRIIGASNIEFQRAHKACIPCRKRKARCDIGPGSAPPCVRCRRDRKECIFSGQRTYNSVKRKRAAMERQLRGTDSSTPAWDPVANGHDAQLSATPQKANLTDSVMRTVVSSGNDALYVLFEPPHIRMMAQRLNKGQSLQVLHLERLLQPPASRSLLNPVLGL
jgi:Fungal Zn(2)-Cys(6) binuclear cluster domain